MASWWEREQRTYKGTMLRGWANLVASRYGRPVYLTGGALKDAWKIARTLEHLDKLDDPFFGETPHVLTHPRFEELDD